MIKHRFLTKTYSKTDLVVIFGFTDFRAMKAAWYRTGLDTVVPLLAGKQTFVHTEFEAIKKAFGMPERRK